MTPKERQRLASTIAFVAIVAAYVAWNAGVFRTKSGLTNASQSAAVVLSFGGGLADPTESATGVTFSNALGKELAVPVLARGKAGETALKASSRAPSVAAADKPNFVVLTVGLNDLAVRAPLDETLRGFEDSIAAFQSSGALVIVLGTSAPDVGDNWEMALRDLTRSKGALWVQDPLAGKWSDPVFAHDLTPTDIGTARLADGVATALKPLLEEAKR